MLMNYNGVSLPALPRNDTSAYPYAWIRKNDDTGYWDLVYGDHKFYYVESDNSLHIDYTEIYYKLAYGTYDDSTQWTYVTLNAMPDYWTLSNTRTIQWSSFDVPIGSESGTDIYYRGSNPTTLNEYSSVESIVAGVDNAKQTRTNSKLDDRSDSVVGVDFFKYNGNVVSNVYLNGNSYIGFGSDAADLKVNNRDNAMYNGWREEGSLSGVRFLRVRWGGYANYNVQYDEYKLTYDVLMFETGDICLYMADIPTSNNTGNYKLGDQTYTAPTTDNRWVTFYKTDTGFKVKYEPISFVQSLTKYLIRNEGTLYTIVDGALSELTGELTADLFQTSGVDAVPDGALLMTLSAPEVLCWTNEDTVPVLAATVQGVPTGTHTVTSDHIQVNHPSIYGISSVVATASDGATFLLSFDGGAWMKYNDGTWSVSDIGMTAAELIAIPSNAWSSVINSAQYMQLKATLEGVETVTQVVFNYNNESPTS